jgi:uncharacterized membrane protein YoaK (UPF0700 family)
VRGRLEEHGVRDLLLVALTVSTGAVDAISWLVLDKVFSAFMTGNLVYLGFRTAGAPGPSLPGVVAAVGAFAVGAALAARIVAPSADSERVWPHRVTLALGATLVAQAAFLAVWIGVDAQPSRRAGDVLIAVSALAMGMQTSAIFSLGVRAVFTTAATATWAVLMGDLSGWSQSRGERRRLSAVIVGLFAGAVVGGLLVVHARSLAPVFPLIVTGIVVAVAALAFESSRSSASTGLNKPLDAIHSER